MSTSSNSRFRPFKVVKKVRESSTITSFYFAPIQSDHWRRFEAGQFLTIRVPDGKTDRPVIRNYTVSSAPADEGFYRITVKKEIALVPGIADGLASSWLHDVVEEGTIVDIDGPHGAFKLDRLSKRPVILLSAGVGITPTISMLKVLANESDRPVWFIHACDGGAVHALESEVDALAAIRQDLNVHYCYRFPSDEDTRQGRYHSTGFISRPTLQKLLPLDDYEVYMCGPPPFMQAMYDLLLDLGIEKNKIAYEFFGPASLLAPSKTPEPAAPNMPKPAEPADDPSTAKLCVTLRKSGDKFEWKETSESILSFLEAQGIEPAFSCRAGVCGSCLQTLVSGDVVYTEEPLEETPSGKVLLCCTKPTSSIVLDL
ncbi:2Fe-2S iron-sulfur cluster binding domain-containing protein [Rhizobium lusitanum]|uniref:nitric oxide dioxygenase n=1 Tax=Rhizobium lusitanum TaxID=293958 RepID=A0A6L9UG29_9HYPH|nr:FAD-binding oxidoreductase [Rhizobium lusitanum]NEI74973.1 2Fe-2S iron-sulfur cluster binding domain-containing protein [Rhizobium lusitanum]